MPYFRRDRAALLRSTAAAPFVWPALVAPNFSDDFELPVGTSAMVGRTNWTAQDQSMANLEVKDGYVHGINQFGPGGAGFFGTGIGDQVATFNYSTASGNGDVYEDGRQYFYVWYQDTNNHVRVELATGVSRLTIRTVVAGAQTAYEFANVTFLSSGEIRLLIRNGKFEAMVDGQWVRQVNGVFSWPLDVVDFSSLSAGAKTGLIGIYSQLWRYPLCNALKVRSLDLAIDSCDTFVGESTIDGPGGIARLAMTMAAGASPTLWGYRLLTPGTLAEVKAWAPLTSVVVVGSAVTAQAFIPTGGPYIIEAGYRDASDNLSRTNYTKPVRSGILWGVMGQSNAFNRSGGVDGGTPALNVKIAGASTNLTGAIISGAPAGSWSTSTDAYNPNCMYEFARVLSGLIGKPVGCFAVGNPSTGLAHNSVGGAGWSTFTNALASFSGICRGVIWDQGENDADGGISPTGYASFFLSTTLPGFRSATGNPNLPIYISPVGRFASTSPPNPPGGAAQGDAHRDVLRQQKFAIVAGDIRCFIGDWKLGTNHGADAYHYQPGTLGYPEMGRRAAYSVAKNTFGISTADGLGALPISATRTTNIIDIAVNLNGGNGLTGPTSISTGTAGTSTLTALNGWQVSTDNFVTTVAISSVTVVGGNIRLTLAANPGAAGKVRFCYGYSYDDSNLVYTTYADGRANIPVRPFETPLNFT
jgi:hypothetical protein